MRTTDQTGTSVLAALQGTIVSRRTLLTGVGIGSLALAGCTPGNGASAAKRLSFWVISSFTEKPDNALANTLKEFSEESGIDVDLQSFPPGDFKNKYMTAVLGGGGPDIAAIDAAWTAELSAAETIADVSSNWSGIADRFLPGSAEAAAVGDKQYAVPWYANNVALYCNGAMLDSAGLAPPTDWTELRDTAMAMTGDGKYGLMLGANWLGSFLWWSFLWQNGGEILDEGLTKSAFASDVGLESWDFYTGLAMRDKVVPPQFTGVNAGWDQYWTPFIQQQVGMMICGDWAINAVREGAPDLDLRIVPLPAGSQRASLVGGYNLATSTRAGNPDGAWRLTEWLVNSGRDEMLQGYGRMPARIDAAGSLANVDGDRAAFAQQADVARARPVLSKWAQLENDILASAWDSTILGTVSSEVALRDAATKVDAALS